MATGDSEHQVSETALALVEEQAEQSIRRVWHEGRWFFSVIYVIGVLTDSLRPRKYWSDMKKRIQDEGFIEASTKCLLLEMLAPDGKMRYTDCADAVTLREIRRFVPGAAVWRRKSKPEGVLYAIGLPDGSMVKIGTTTDLAGRLRGIQNTSPVPVMLIWHAPGAGSLERQLHARFANRRAHGEWFSFAGADVIAELQAAVAEIRGHSA